MDFEKLNQQHRKAMELASQALLARQRGDEGKAVPLFREAYELERGVANEIAPTDLEPSRSVIHRSAATLAVDCGEYREAEKLLLTALLGNPPASIAAKLRELLMQVVPHLQRAVGD
ncbi:MAG: hypothetical protein Q9P01_02955 [Anaerolineae bacterium]|nr:hypothetical protein [Anaerolineae bacterium]MDQ7033812.1 hypothetical protein [Anaerolineae bacterium]